MANKKRVSRGERNIAWIEKYCYVPEGKLVGKPFKLRDWQKKIIRGIYDSPTRRALISFGRKNGKTALMAALLLLHLVGPEARRNSQLFSAAQSRDQASLLFSLAAKMVRLNVDLAPHILVRDSAKQLFCKELGTLYRALSADASTAFGLSPVFVVHDELGQVRGPRSELYEALETACAAQDDPLSLVISTQAPTDADLFSILIDDAASNEDKKTKLFMHSAPIEDDPFSVETIKKANPAFGDFQNADEVLATANSAKRMPSMENGYRNLILNQRISQHSTFVSLSVWDSCNQEPLPEAFYHGKNYIGLDLSARNDLTALVQSAFYENEWHVRCEFFTPELGLLDRAHAARAPYDVWQREELLTVVPGSSIDYEVIAKRLVEICSESEVVAIGFDRWRIDVLQKELDRMEAFNLPLLPFGQGFKDMSPAIDLLEGELLAGRIRHDGNPILKWCVSNAVVVTDPAQNRKFDKSKGSGKIDGLIGLTISLGVAHTLGSESAAIPAMEVWS